MIAALAHPPPSPLTDWIATARVDLERDGVARLPAVFDRDEIDRARAAATLALTRLPEITAAGYPRRAPRDPAPRRRPVPGPGRCGRPWSTRPST